MVIFHSYVSLPEGIYITVTNIIKYMNDIAYIINFIINAEFIIYIYTYLYNPLYHDGTCIRYKL